MPSVIVIREKAADTTEYPEAYDIPLMLPSSLSAQTLCDRRLLQIKFELRFAQCNEALNDLRNELCARAYVLIDKSRFQRGQKANTRSESIIDTIKTKVDQAAEEYRGARAALSALATRLNKVGWDRDFLPLQDGDIRPLVIEDITQKEMRRRSRAKQNSNAAQSEGRRTVSWIWLKNASNPYVHEDSESEKARLHESTFIIRYIGTFKC